jgi:hypothetical protein
MINRDSWGPRAEYPVLGLYQTKAHGRSGRIVAFGDSNCLDNAHQTKPCYWLMNAFLEYTSTGHIPKIIRSSASLPIKPKEILPRRVDKNKLHRYSKVLQSNIGDVYSTEALPSCIKLIFLVADPLNTTASSSLYKLQKLQDLGPPGSHSLQEIRTLAKVKDTVANAASYDDEMDWLGSLDAKEGSDPRLWTFLVLVSILAALIIINRFCSWTHGYRYLWRTKLGHRVYAYMEPQIT